MKRAPTIRDVAKACGLSHMTVSNVMNNRPVSEATRKQVLEAMRELNYQPSAIARGLNRKPMDTLGVVLPHSQESPLSHPYFGPVVDGIMAAAVSLHKDITIYTGSLWTGDGEGLRRYRDGRTDGLLLVTPLAQPELVRALLEVRVPFVCIGAYSADPEVRFVTSDDARDCHRIVDHLAGLGHRRIGFFSIGKEGAFKGPRCEGYQKAMTAVELPLNDDWIWYDGLSPGRVRRMAEAFASMPIDTRPTAVFCFNDEIAIAFIQHLATLGVKVPEDVSVTGFDDIPAAEKHGLTTARQPMREIGARAARLLTEVLDGEADLPRTVYFESDLVVRTSTAAPVG